MLTGLFMKTLRGSEEQINRNRAETEATAQRVNGTLTTALFELFITRIATEIKTHHALV